MSKSGLVAPECGAGNLCKVFGWGPVERDADDDASRGPHYHNHIHEAGNFTLFVKSYVRFSAFDTSFSNIDALGPNAKTVSWRRGGSQTGWGLTAIH